MSAPTFDRVEIPLADVDLSDAERRKLLARHARIDFEFRDVWDEAAGAIVDKAIPFAEAICGECREPWGKYGCATARAVTLLGIYEREAKKGARRIEELTEALTPRFGVERLREPGNRTTMLTMRVDEYALLYGRIGVVDRVLEKMRREWERWLKDYGDRARIRADHAYALTMDSERYTYLTQQFDSSAAFRKRPNAPWDDKDGAR